MQRSVSIVCAAIFAAFLAPAASFAAPATVFGTNLIVDGDAESPVTGAPSNSLIVKPATWTTTGEFTVVQYGASGGFPDKTSPGPATRGKNLFEGGNVALSTASQTIDVSAGAADIDAATVTYAFSTWLGGYASQDDNARVDVSFLASDGSVLGKTGAGPVLAAERKNLTGLLLKSTAGTVPAKTRSVRVLVTLTRKAGLYNDGSADDLSLVFTKK